MSKFTNSPLVNYTKISPNKTSPRNKDIDTITIHCVAGNCTVETIGAIFAPSSRQASSNYGVGSDGRIGMYVEEKDRSWCTSSGANDHRAITIEVSNDSGAPEWHVSDKALVALINLCTDICKRNNIKKLIWKADKSLIGQPELQNMTVHRWFAAKSCPGDYLYRIQGNIADEINKRLGGTVTPTPTPAPGPSVSGLKVGDIVNFTGTTHFTSSQAASGVSCKPGKAKITAIALNTKHPYHLVREPGGATVYGWVDTKDITTASAPAKKSIDEIAREVITGKWGNGQVRKDNLKAAGYDPTAVQARVNQLLGK